MMEDVVKAEVVKRRTDLERQTILDAIDHETANGDTLAHSLIRHGITHPTYVAWLKKLTRPNDIGPDCSYPVEREATTVQGAIEVIKSLCPTCIIVAEKDSAIYAEIQGDQKDYEMLQAFVSLKALRDFKKKA